MKTDAALLSAARLLSGRSPGQSCPQTEGSASLAGQRMSNFNMKYGRGASRRTGRGRKKWRIRMWKGFRKAVTFSYDDGVESDRKLLDILNRYHLKGTFNLNAGLLGSPDSWDCKGFQVARLPLDNLGALYQGHEIAVHGLLHLHPTELSREAWAQEIGEDKKRLEALFGAEMAGMAYAYGQYDDQVVEVVKETGLRYARTVQSTHGFAPQANLLTFHPTCHHNDPQVFELIERFLSCETDEPQLFYLWGHSYELDADQNWDRFERICSMLAGRDGVFYGTNREVLLGE